MSAQYETFLPQLFIHCLEYFLQLEAFLRKVHRNLNFKADNRELAMNLIVYTRRRVRYLYVICRYEAILDHDKGSDVVGVFRTLSTWTPSYKSIKPIHRRAKYFV